MTTARSIIKLSREALRQSEKNKKDGTCTYLRETNKLHYKYVLTSSDKAYLSQEDPAETSFLSWRDAGYWFSHEFKIFPLDKIAKQKTWSEGKLRRVREDITRDVPLSPVRISEDPETHRFEISDGIHRINGSLEFGFTHIPALVSFVHKEKPKGVNAQRLIELENRDEANLFWNKLRYEFQDLAYIKVDSSVEDYMLWVEHWTLKSGEKQIEFHVKCHGLDRTLTIVVDSSVFLREKSFAGLDEMVRFILLKKEELIS